ncbi:restriction endonuclease subunit S [Clostridium sp. OS1-26]|uniref:restriction endonuclease subunit S n=1 Tax=Clostridium sp. OS1-26 TaxID=3070681 RepID=UPI0027E2051F|nr:restriction endonuclease subunit S [Clostridium sp. OS1-26]WML32650.1 restriction endonuclease subunit S [Clostridium sp. OS1-26]
MNLIKLGEIYKITSGGTPSRGNSDFYSDGSIPWIKTGDLKQKYIEKASEHITELAVEKSSAKLFPSGTVLIAMYGATIGATSILNIEATTNQACAAFLPNNRVLPEYLYYFFRANKTKIVSMGVGGAQPNISATILKEVKFPLKDLGTQKKIINLLAKAQELIDKRKAQIEALDELIKSVFYDMFGDLKINNKGWKISRLIDICNKITDGTHDTPVRVSKGVKFITGKNIRPFKLDLSDLEFVTQEIHEEIYKRCNPQYGDILYTNIGSGVGSAIFNPLDEEFSMKNVALLKVDKEKVDSKYLEYELNYLKDYIIDKNCRGGAQTFLTLKAISNVELPIPNIFMQNRFVEIVIRIEKQKYLLQQSLTELENNFNSLMQKAFKGELFN